jgi:phosphohistidine phosphatase
MAAWLNQNDSVPGIILTSNANRALSTAKTIQSLSRFEGELFEYKQLYLGEPADYLRLLARLDDQVETAMVVGHNHGLEHLVERVTGQWATMPTAAIAKIDLKIERWLTVESVTDGKLLDVWRPKEIDDEFNAS